MAWRGTSFDFGYPCWGSGYGWGLDSFETTEDQLRKDIFSIRNLAGYRYLSQNPNNRPKFVNGVCTLAEHDYCAVRALGNTLDLLKKDLPQQKVGPQCIGSEGNLYHPDLWNLRYRVTDFAKQTEYPTTLQHDVTSCCPEVLKPLADGSLRAVTRDELAKDDPLQLAGFDDADPMEKGRRIELPLFKWLQRLLKDYCTQDQVSLEQDNHIYSNIAYNVLTSTLDGFINIIGKRSGCLEIKSCYSNPKVAGYNKLKGQPVSLIREHQTWRQIQAYLHIMDLEFCLHFIYFDKSEEGALICVDRDTKAFNQMYKNFVLQHFLPQKLMPMFANAKEQENGQQFKLTTGLAAKLAKHLCRGFEDPAALFQPPPVQSQNRPQTSQNIPPLPARRAPRPSDVSPMAAQILYILNPHRWQ